MAKLQKNIYKLYLIQGINSFMVFAPIFVIFFQHYGLSMAQVLILQAVFSMALVIMQIPTGYFADLMGRKKSIVYGTFVVPLAFLIYALSSSFIGFLLAEITLAVAVSFISGADSALIYDSLIELKKEKSYKKVEGKYSFISGSSEAIASIFGGFLAAISINLPFFVQAGIALLAIPVALSLYEPEIHKEDFHKEKEGSFQKIYNTIKYSIHEHKEIKWLIFYSAIVGSATFSMVWFTQPYMKSVGLPLPYFGIVWASFLAFFGISSLFAHKYEEIVGRKNSLISLIIFVTLGYFLVAFVDKIWGLVFILFFYLVRGLKEPIIKDYINKLIPSNVRATVLSVKSMTERIVFSIIGPFIGWFNDLYSFRIALVAAGSTFIALGLISLVFLHLNKALNISDGKNSL